MLEALEGKATHLVGLGRPSIEADLPKKLVANSVTGALITRPLEGIANFAFCQVQFDRMAMGLAPDVQLDMAYSHTGHDEKEDATGKDDKEEEPVGKDEEILV